jgi:hypothetical protein
MHLNEFANPKDYAPTVGDSKEFRNQLLLIWPDRPADELAPSAQGSRKLPPGKRMNHAEALSIRGHVGGDQLRSRRGASQWPTA